MNVAGLRVALQSADFRRPCLLLPHRDKSPLHQRIGMSPFAPVNSSNRTCSPSKVQWGAQFPSSKIVWQRITITDKDELQVYYVNLRTSWTRTPTRMPPIASSSCSPESNRLCKISKDLTSRATPPEPQLFHGIDCELPYMRSLTNGCGEKQASSAHAGLG